MKALPSTLLVLFYIALLPPLRLAAQQPESMAIAYIAYQRLSDGPRHNLNDLLKHHPCYTIWRSDAERATPSGNKESTLFLIASQIPVRGESIGDSDSRVGKPPYQSEPNCERVADSMLLTSEAQSLKHSQFGMPPEGSPQVVTDVVQLETLLKSKATLPFKAAALVALLRAVALAHLPSQCPSSQSRAVESRLERKCPDCGKTPLQAITPRSLSDEVLDAVHIGDGFIQSDTPAEVEFLSPEVWIAEDCELAQRLDRAPGSESSSYGVARYRADVGGLRLASILYEVLGFAS